MVGAGRFRGVSGVRAHHSSSDFYSLSLSVLPTKKIEELCISLWKEIEGHCIVAGVSLVLGPMQRNRTLVVCRGCDCRKTVAHSIHAPDAIFEVSAGKAQSLKSGKHASAARRRAVPRTTATPARTTSATLRLVSAPAFCHAPNSLRSVLGSEGSEV